MKKKKLTREQLKNIYQNNNVDKASKILGMCVPKMYELLESTKIKLKGRGRTKENKIIIID